MYEKMSDTKHEISKGLCSQVRSLPNVNNSKIGSNIHTEKSVRLYRYKIGVEIKKCLESKGRVHFRRG